jgi:hypothetical protein
LWYNKNVLERGTGKEYGNLMTMKEVFIMNKQFFVHVTVNICEYVVIVTADSELQAERKVLDKVTRYKGERKVYAKATDDITVINCYHPHAEIIDMIGIERVIKNYCDEMERQERCKLAIDQTVTICALMNKLGEDMNFKSLDDLKHDNKVLQEMLKVLKGATK